MTAHEIEGVAAQYLSSKPGYDEAVVKQVAGHVAGAVAAAPAKGSGGTSACYQACETTRNAALAAAALKGWPGSVLAVGAAVMAFNACRHDCDTAGS